MSSGKQSCNACDTVDYAGELDDAGRCSECVAQEREFVAHHDGDAHLTKRLRVLGEWCRRFAAQNTDPDAIDSPAFDRQVLAIWHASGKAVTERKDDQDDAHLAFELLADDGAN